MLRVLERKVYSQNGEDGIIESLFDLIGTTDKFFVEIGCEDGTECNTRKLLELDGWTGIRLDNNNSSQERRIFRQYVTPENVVDLFHEHGVQKEFDFLSVDVDFSDFHILNAVLKAFRPRVICSEYNSSLGPDEDMVVPYVPGQYWDRTNYFGASFTAFARLGAAFGYRVACCDANGVNVFLIRSDLFPAIESEHTAALFSPPGYNGGRGHPADPKRRPYLSSRHYLLDSVSTADTQFGRINFFNHDRYIGRTFAHGGYWEMGTVTEIGRQLAGRQGRVLDVGGHIGSHSIALARMNPNLRFTCFEPQRHLFLLLQRNVAENGLWDRFEVVNAAVGSAEGWMSLSATVEEEESGAQRPIQYDGSAPINLGGVQLGPGGEQCRIVRIDDRDLTDVEYIKVDVEGAEPLAFHGMQQTIRRNLPFILFEDRADRRLAPETLDQLGIPDDIRAFSPRGLLTSLGYKIHQLGLDFVASPPDRHDPAAVRIAAEDRIPSRIFQTWKSKTQFPTNYAFWKSTFTTQNPYFEHVIWDDHDNRAFIENYFPWFLDIYAGYPREIYRADAIRYFYLYAFGGIYADMDVECLRPLDGLLDRGNVVLGRMGSDPDFPHSIPNAAMASRPREEFWLLPMALMMEEAHSGGPPEHCTGPVLLKRAVDLYLVSDPDSARSRIDSIAARLPETLRPRPTRTRLTVLRSRDWFAVDWSDPIHQMLRHDVLHGNGLLSDERKKQLFPHSWMVTYWTHNW